jgi:hypothetical protein
MEPRSDAVPGRHYEFRVVGRLSERARGAFDGMEVREVPAETVISGDLAEAGGVQEVLSLIQSLGLHVVSVRRTPDRGPLPGPGDEAVRSPSAGGPGRPSPT